MIFELEKDYLKLKSSFEKEKVKLLLSKENDFCSAFLEINAGAGGKESCDWVSMLYRMYSRWASKHKFKTELIDILYTEGGIKSLTLEHKW